MLLKISCWLFLVPFYLALLYKVVDLQVTIIICLICGIANHIFALPFARLVDIIVVNGIAAFYTIDAIKHRYWGVVMMSGLSLYVFLTSADWFGMSPDLKHAILHVLTAYGISLYVLYRVADKRYHFTLF